MSSKINPRFIIGAHLRTLVDNRTGQLSKIDLISSFLLPLVASLLITWQAGVMSDNTVTVLITALSIFSALLFNSLIIIYERWRQASEEFARARPDPNDRVATGFYQKSDLALRVTLLRETYQNISFAIFVSLLAVALLVLVSIARSTTVPGIVSWAMSFLVYYLSGIFLFTVLMVLKRMTFLLVGQQDVAG